MCEGGYRVWIPRIGYPIRRDCARVTRPWVHCRGPMRRDRVQVVQSPKTTPGPTTPELTPAPQDTEDVSEDNNKENGDPAARTGETDHSFGCLAAIVLVLDRRSMSSSSDVNTRPVDPTFGSSLAQRLLVACTLSE